MISECTLSDLQVHLPYGCFHECIHDLLKLLLKKNQFNLFVQDFSYVSAKFHALKMICLEGLKNLEIIIFMPKLSHDREKYYVEKERTKI